MEVIFRKRNKACIRIAILFQISNRVIVFMNVAEVDSTGKKTHNKREIKQMGMIGSCKINYMPLFYEVLGNTFKILYIIFYGRNSHLWASGLS